MLTRLLRLFIFFTFLFLVGCAHCTINHGLVTVQKGHLEYYQLGNGTPIVLIAGYLTDVSSWDKRFLQSLAEQHQVIVFNNRNVGKSIISSDRYKTADLATDVHQLIQQLQLKKPAVVGISMGGMIAQQLAVLYPNAIGQLILINTGIAGKQFIHPNSTIEKMMLTFPNNKLAQYQMALKLFFPESKRFQMGTALLFNRFLPEGYTEININAVKLNQQFLVTQWLNDNATAKKIASIQLPVLILNGEADYVIPPANSVILANTIPHSILIRWNEGGHAMIYQYPEELAEIINEFITYYEN